MGLSQARKQFFEIRQKAQILIKSHAFKDYPERGFSKSELVRLVRFGMGRFTDNDSHQGIDGSYLFFPTDEEERECKLVVLIEVVQFEGEEISQKVTVIVCSAYREV
jgi:hypothetical protein